MLQLRDVSKSFGGPAGRRVLDGVALTVVPGEYVAIVGESGVGKSTLLNLIAGLDVPDSGRAAARRAVTSPGSARTSAPRSVARRMGFVFQAFHLLPHLSIARNVALPLALNGQAGRAADDRVMELLEAVGLADRASSFPRELSGGEIAASRRGARAGAPSRAGARRRADGQSRSRQRGDDPRNCCARRSSGTTRRAFSSRIPPRPQRRPTVSTSSRAPG